MIYFIHISHISHCDTEDDNDKDNAGNVVANISFCFRFYLYLLVIVYSFCCFFSPHSGILLIRLLYLISFHAVSKFSRNELVMLSRPFQGSVLTCLESSLICVNFFLGS